MGSIADRPHLFCESFMKIGDLCKVIREDTHTTCHKGNLVLILKTLGSVYLECVNLETGAFHHYCRNDLEVISEAI